MTDPKKKTKQKSLLPDGEVNTGDGQDLPQSLQENRKNWLEKILNERYPKVEYKNGGYLTPEKIAEKPEVWRGC